MLKIATNGLWIWKNFWFQRKNKKSFDNSFSYRDENIGVDFVHQWNIKFPLDRWFRKKYNLAFGSSAHRDFSVLDIRFEWDEDKVFRELEKEDEYTPNIGNFLEKRKIKYANEEDELSSFKAEFKKLDLSQFDD